MNEISTAVYESLLVIGDYEFQRGYRYIRCLAHSPETSNIAVEYVATFGWYPVDPSLPHQLDSHRTTADDAMRIMEEAKRLREL